MKDPIDTMAALRGGLALTIASALVMLGPIMILDLMHSDYAWGVFSIICGLVFFAGIRYFGTRGI